MNNNCQECDFSMESLFLRCNKLFRFCSKDTHISNVPSNQLLKLIARLTSCVQASFML